MIVPNIRFLSVLGLDGVLPEYHALFTYARRAARGLCRSPWTRRPSHAARYTKRESHHGLRWRSSENSRSWCCAGNGVYCAPSGPPFNHEILASVPNAAVLLMKTLFDLRESLEFTAPGITNNPGGIAPFSKNFLFHCLAKRSVCSEIKSGVSGESP